MQDSLFNYGIILKKCSNKNLTIPIHTMEKSVSTFSPVQRADTHAHTHRHTYHRIIRPLFPLRATLFPLRSVLRIFHFRRRNGKEKRARKWERPLLTLLNWLNWPYLERSGQHQLNDHVQREVKSVWVQKHVGNKPPALNSLPGIVDQPLLQRRLVAKVVNCYLKERAFIFFLSFRFGPYFLLFPAFSRFLLHLIKSSILPEVTNFHYYLFLKAEIVDLEKEELGPSVKIMRIVGVKIK